MNRAQHQLMQIVQKIPVFDGLSLEQAERVIKTSRFKMYEAGGTVYEIGEASEEMLVLIKGKLSVLSATGQLLGEVAPGMSTGEMGLFTGHVRSATIVALEECAGLILTRSLLREIMNSDREMKAIILENAVRQLSDRLADANTRLDALIRAQQEADVVEEEAVDELEAEEDDAGSDEQEEESVPIEDDGEMPEAEDPV
ncbi:MAG: hypothetical protein CL902_03640 [Dehalococcoidia bacterium]|nr:hypothetical protein [Dehalococcoidia bacterium]